MNTPRVCMSCRLEIARAYSRSYSRSSSQSYRFRSYGSQSHHSNSYHAQSYRSRSGLGYYDSSLRTRETLKRSGIPSNRSLRSIHTILANRLTRSISSRRSLQSIPSNRSIHSIRSKRSNENVAQSSRGSLEKGSRRFASTGAVGKQEQEQDQERDGPVIKRASRVITRSEAQGQEENVEQQEEVLDDVGQEDAKEAVEDKEAMGEAVERKEDATETEDVTDPQEHDPEGIAFAARQYFGDRLPRGLLNEEEYRIYERNYGPPSGWDDLSVGTEGEDDGMTLRAAKDVLLKELADGTLEEVIREDEYMDEEDVVDEEAEEPFALDEQVVTRDGPWTDVQTALDAVPYERTVSELVAREPVAPILRFGEQMDEPDGEDLRAHPFTIHNRFATDPTTISIPRDNMTGHVLTLLSDVNNKHLSEAAHRLFGGPGLPYATGTPAISRKMPQKPIPLTATQSKMTHMEAHVFCATLMPGIYAAVTSTLVEVRKRLGSAWLQELMDKPGGPKVLDVGGAGAGVVVWKEILRAEWARMHGDLPATPVPEGKATVIAAAPQLLEKASRMLENTSFLPRLPDYVHAVFHSGAQRKEYDVIVAPHTLWSMEGGEDARKLHLDKLWSLLSPHGGVLVVIEKGVPRGFEALADARQYLLDRYLEPQDAVEEDSRSKSKTARPAIPKGQDVGGAIVAPCTNHKKCPMYPVPGLSQQRKDYCHFSQRYIRPSYYQHILGAKGRNHDDVRFSYVAVQKGVKAEAMKPKQSARDSLLGNAIQDRKLGDYATDRAFEGFALDDPDVARPLHNLDRPANASSPLVASPHAAPNPFSLPRNISPPLKRRGHVTFDVCTPSGTLQRWTVARSFGKQAYRDARKLQWGDLWALGAATRVPKNVRLGKLSKNEAKQDPIEEEDEEEGPEDDDDVVEAPRRFFGKADKAGQEPSKGKQKRWNARNKRRSVRA